MLFLKVLIIEKCKRNRNFQNFKLVVPLKDSRRLGRDMRATGRLLRQHPHSPQVHRQQPPPQSRRGFPPSLLSRFKIPLDRCCGSGLGDFLRSSRSCQGLGYAGDGEGERATSVPIIIPGSFLAVLGAGLARAVIVAIIPIIRTLFPFGIW